MSTAQLKSAVATANGTASLPDVIKSITGENFKKQVALALPKHLNADRMVRIALTEVRKNPKLLECDPTSVMGSIIVLSQLGLEIGVQGQAYLVPYKDHKRGMICQPIPGWKGLVDLVSRSGRATVHTAAVYEGDEFEYEYGTNPHIRHKPSDEVEQTIGNLTHCYAVGRVKGAEYPVIEVWSKKKLSAHRDRFNRVGDSHYSFQHPEMYGRKIPLLQVIKYLPTSIEVQVAMDLADHEDAGVTVSIQDPRMLAGPGSGVDISTGEIIEGESAQSGQSGQA